MGRLDGDIDTLQSADISRMFLPELLRQQLVLALLTDLSYPLESGVTDLLHLGVPVVEEVQEVRSGLGLLLDVLSTGRVTAQLVENVNNLNKQTVRIIQTDTDG